MPLLVQTIAVDVLRMVQLDGRCLVKFLTNLKKVEVFEGIERIGKSCFFDKRGIVSVRFPKSLKSIGSHAFRNCIGLETVIFEGDEVEIHPNAFQNCSALKQIQTCDGSWHQLQGIKGLSAMENPRMIRLIQQQVLGNFKIIGTILMKYQGEESRVVIPEGITVIAEEAFAGKETIDRVILPESLQEIGAKAFQDCLLMQTINIPQGVRRIGESAFENCVKLIRTVLPAELTCLEDRVFKHCRSLREIELGEKLEEIGAQAFYGCRSLKAISFPVHLKSICEMAFYRCSALQEVKLPGELEQLENLAFAQSGIKKAQLLGNGKGYGTGIFSGCSSLKRLVFGDDVRHLPDKLAYHCTALKHVVLPERLESAGRNIWEKTPFLEEWIRKEQKDTEIFWDGRHLEGNQRLSASVRILAGGAFYGNTKVTEIILPETIQWIGAAAFKGCRSLRRVSWPEKMTKIQDETFSGCQALETVDIKHPWESVGRRAFYGCSKLRQIDWEQLKKIDAEAFCGCRLLKPGKVRQDLQIGDRALEETSWLKGEAGKPTIVGGWVVATKGCQGEIFLSEGITGIAPFAFAGNGLITKVVFPESLYQIGEGAFWGCGQLAEVIFPHRSCRIEARAFEKCISLTTVAVNAEYGGEAAFAYCTELTSVMVTGLKILEERMFEGCRELKEVVGQGIEWIKSRCFCGCEKLENFHWKEMRRVDRYAWEGCNSIRRIWLPEGVSCMPYAWKDCGGLEEVEVEKEGHLYLKEYAFSGCTALKKVKIQGREWTWNTYQEMLSEEMPETVRMIFHSAFSCFDIEQDKILRRYHGSGKLVCIPPGIQRIDAEVFRNVLGLEEVEIPQSVNYIGARAFHGTTWMERKRQLSAMVIVNHMLLDGSGCRGEVVIEEDILLVCGWAFANGMEIEKIQFLSPYTKVEEYAFRNCIYLRELILPDGKEILITGIEDRKRELPLLAKQAVMDAFHCFKTDEHQVLTECTGNISRIKIAEGITGIGDGVFQDSNLLTEVTLPLSITFIGKKAFAGCKWLKTVLQAQGVERIEEGAFGGCSRLQRVEVSERLHDIGKRAFEHCTALEEMMIPEGVEKIPEKAFYRCHSLRKIQLPSTIKEIGDKAFAFCHQWNLKEK